MLLDVAKELRRELHKSIEDEKYQLFVTDFVHFLLEETNNHVIKGEYSPDINQVIIALDMQQEYIRYGTYHPMKLDLDKALKMVARLCEDLGITMELIEGNEYGYMIPVSLVEHSGLTLQEMKAVDTIKGFSK